MGINSTFRGRVVETAAIGPYLIVKAGTAAMSCVVATAATDKLLGTSDELSTPVGDVCDVAVGSVPKVTLGGTVAAGDALTSNGSGQAIATTTTGNRIIGYAETPGVSGDVITYLRALGTI